MKQIFATAIALLALIICQAQTLEITTDKTTSIVFPFAVKHVDRGTKDILVQLVKESDNMVLVKAGSKTFDPSNLIVVTTDGSIYSFPVEYRENPVESVYRIPAQQNATVETYANGILDNVRTIWGVQDHSWGILSSIAGIYIRNNVIYYQLRMKNNSPIDYDVDFIRFYVRDKKKGKRTAVQETELKPLFVAGNQRLVTTGKQNTAVAALEKFTIPDGKYLAVEIMEKNGGRHLSMKVSNKKIMHAINLPDLK